MKCGKCSKELTELEQTTRICAGNPLEEELLAVICADCKQATSQAISDLWHMTGKKEND